MATLYLVDASFFFADAHLFEILYSIHGYLCTNASKRHAVNDAFNLINREIWLNNLAHQSS